jgi:hypothetical protein
MSQTDLNTYFCRHGRNLCIDDQTRDMLWSDKKIAIHYPWTTTNPEGSAEDSQSLVPEDYARGDRKTISAFNQLANEGGYVCAEYLGHAGPLLGRISPGTKVQLLDGYWDTAVDGIPHKAILKTLRLEESFELPATESVVLLAGRPPFVTITRWNAAKSLVADLVKTRQVAPVFDSLIPALQEVMCAEFLRSRDAEKCGLPRIVHLIMPVGRTLKDIDIFGFDSDGKRVAAQVTYSNFGSVGGKFQSLEDYGGGDAAAHLVLFCNVDVKRIQHEVTVFPIREAFRLFVSSPSGKQWLRLALPRCGPID